MARSGEVSLSKKTVLLQFLFHAFCKTTFCWKLIIQWQFFSPTIGMCSFECINFNADIMHFSLALTAQID